MKNAKDRLTVLNETARAVVEAHERPHEALGINTPAELYSASAQPHDGLPDLSYLLHDREVVVTARGRICMHRKRINLSTVLAGQRVGIKEVDEGI
ncbi:MAG TPA: hypothetical protein VEN29_21680 [Casimicrobiaceae bacterium]|nr:hypothetical protein [Casimicrobiaceae bacterium]